MLRAERIDRIIGILEEKGVVSVNDLSRHFGVTTMTIRRDLDELDSRGNYQRTHGGAIFCMHAEKENEIPTLDRMKLFINEKIAVAKKAASMIGPEETIFLGSGTTTLCLAKELQNRKDISVVTNSLMIINELATNSQIDLMLVGGFLRRAEFSLIGNFATDMIANLHVDKVFIGMRGIHARFGLTSNHPQEIMTDRAILSMSDNIIVLADHTKIGHVAASRTDYITAAKTIITTDNASREIVDAIIKKGVQVIQI